MIRLALALAAAVLTGCSTPPVEYTHVCLQDVQDIPVLREQLRLLAEARAMTFYDSSRRVYTDQMTLSRRGTLAQPSPSLALDVAEGRRGTRFSATNFDLPPTDFVIGVSGDRRHQVAQALRESIDDEGRAVVAQGPLAAAPPFPLPHCG